MSVSVLVTYSHVKSVSHTLGRGQTHTQVRELGRTHTEQSSEARNVWDKAHQLPAGPNINPLSASSILCNI